jgi:hypothetical protein
MLLPDEHVRPKESLLVQAAFLLRKVEGIKSVGALWAEFSEDKSGCFTMQTYPRFALLLTLLNITQQVVVGDNQVMRAA